MSVRVKTTDGKTEISVKITRQTTVEDFKRKIEKQLNVKKDLQRLFYSGKQLENGYNLNNYNVNFNDIILLMIKSEIDYVENKTTSSDEGSSKEDGEQVIEEEELEETESLYYKIGDAIDCCQEETNAWFEAIIQKTYKKGDEEFYKILWESDNVISPYNVPEARIRPRSWRSIPIDELSVGQKVMINYDLDNDNEKKVGLWYDFTISELERKRNRIELVGQLHISSDGVMTIRTNVKGDIYAIEAPKLLTERTAEDEQYMKSNGKYRPVAPACDECEDNPEKTCHSCGCRICAGKQDEHLLLICDECEDMFHIKCLTPPLLELPQDPHWYCPECKNDENEIVKAGDKLKKTKKEPIRTSKKQNWGGGMACVRRQKICYMVPENHCGPIPGVDVGTTWLFRIQVSEAGVHRPPVGGIHGRVSDCAYSIVLSGGYEEDYDKGDEFLYSGSGGRDLSGNKRTNAQSKDQTLTLMNLALAKNCNAPVNDKIGAEASKKNWREGKPVRVVRNYKLGKFSKYAPKEGNRYDGIYKVVKYYPHKNSDGLLMWKYVLRRDDPAPAPWTKEGKERIAFLGLKMLYPDGYLDGMKTLNQSGGKKRLASDNNEDEDISNKNKITVSKSKKFKHTFDLEDELKALIEDDEVNAKLWTDCKATLTDGKLAFLKCVYEKFECVCCLGVLYKPVTTPCGHNMCLKCLQKSFAAENYCCFICRFFLSKSYDMKINETLSSALQLIFPGYKGEL